MQCVCLMQVRVVAVGQNCAKTNNMFVKCAWISRPIREYAARSLYLLIGPFQLLIFFSLIINSAIHVNCFVVVVVVVFTV